MNKIIRVVVDDGQSPVSFEYDYYKYNFLIEGGFARVTRNWGSVLVVPVKNLLYMMVTEDEE